MSNSVTVSETTNTVSVNETTSQVTVTEGTPTSVEVEIQGPQGPSFSSTNTTLTDSGKVNQSVVYYDSVAGTYKADDTTTTTTLVDGGNF
jgi:hypothetical protein